MINGKTKTKIKKEEPEEWKYVNFYSPFLWKSNDTKFLFIAVNICWQKKYIELTEMECQVGHEEHLGIGVVVGYALCN